MPFIEQNDLVNLYDQIEDLSKKEEELRKGFIDLKLENNRVVKSERIRNAAILVLCLLSSGLAYFLYQSKKQIKQTTAINHQVTKKQLDSIKLVYFNRERARIKKATDKLIYTVQIGAFKELELNFSKEELKNFKKRVHNGFHTYSVGEFETYKHANTFVKEIRRMGVKDAFVLPLKNNKRIDLEEALKESNE